MVIQKLYWEGLTAVKAQKYISNTVPMVRHYEKKALRNIKKELLLKRIGVTSRTHPFFKHKRCKFYGDEETKRRKINASRVRKVNKKIA